MEERSILMVEFEAGREPGQTLRRILESCPNPDFDLACYTRENFNGNDTELPEVILRKKPWLILLVLSRLQLKSLDVLLRVLGPGSSPAPIVVVVEAEQEELTELVQPGVADFIIPPLHDSEVLVRIRRLLNQVAQEQRTQQTLTQKLGLRQFIGQSPSFLNETAKIPLVAKSEISVLISGET